MLTSKIAKTFLTFQTILECINVCICEEKRKQKAELRNRFAIRGTTIDSIT